MSKSLLACVSFACGLLLLSTTASCGRRLSTVIDPFEPPVALKGVTRAFDAYVGRLVAPESISNALFKMKTAPGHGKIVRVDDKSGVFLYVPNDFFFGEDSFTYESSDAKNEPVLQAVKIVVEQRAHPHMNPFDHFDVNNDKKVNEDDYWAVIDVLNAGGSGVLPLPAPNEVLSKFVDVDGDGEVVPLDGSLLVNELDTLSGDPRERPVVNNPCSPGGIGKFEACWYVGPVGESCEAACEVYGGCNEPATLSIGSEAADSQLCADVALDLYRRKGIDHRPLETHGVKSMDSGAELGCWATEGFDALWDSAGESSCGSSLGGFRRICACNH